MAVGIYTLSFSFFICSFVAGLASGAGQPTNLLLCSALGNYHFGVDNRETRKFGGGTEDVAAPFPVLKGLEGVQKFPPPPPSSVFGFFSPSVLGASKGTAQMRFSPLCM